MPNLTVNLTPDLQDFIRESVACGHYENAAEVVRVALRALNSEEGKKRSESDIAKGDVFRKLWELSIQPSISQQQFK
jgi:putative addiction module CopG family antidote